MHGMMVGHVAYGCRDLVPRGTWFFLIFSKFFGRGPWCSGRALPPVTGRSKVQTPASTHCTLCGKGWLLTPFPQTPRNAGAYGTG